VVDKPGEFFDEGKELREKDDRIRVESVAGIGQFGVTAKNTGELSILDRLQN
jgi:hypothetical protein